MSLHIEYPGNVLTPSGYVPSQYYREWCKCTNVEPDTHATDSAGQNRTDHTQNSLPVVDETTAWDTVGWLVGVDGANAGTLAAADVFNWSTASGETLCMSARVALGAGSGAAEWMFGNKQNNTLDSGFALLIHAGNNGIALEIADGDGVSVTGVAGCLAGTHVDDTETTITIFIDSSARRIYCFQDGVIIPQTGQGAENWFDMNKDGAGSANSFGQITNADRSFNLISQGGNTTACEDGKIRDWHRLVLPTMPTNPAQIARHLSSKPFHPLRDTDISF